MEAKGEVGYKRWQVMFVCAQVSVFLSHTHEAVVETWLKDVHSILL